MVVIGLLRAITKQSLLSTIQISTLLLVATILVLLSIINTNEYIQIVYSWFLCLAIGTINLCIYLGFVFNKRYYELLCGKCHASCSRKCERIAERKSEDVHCQNSTTI